ncbi:MAG: hypothetical protein PHQ20_04000 [Candidatus Moranbacteria bacterium]|jgi:hypothetical protein|nr:hypothetical protein [Candidatus Moranbacteria bacterium]
MGKGLLATEIAGIPKLYLKIVILSLSKDLNPNMTRKTKLFLPIYSHVWAESGFPSQVAILGEGDSLSERGIE